MILTNIDKNILRFGWIKPQVVGVVSVNKDAENEHERAILDFVGAEMCGSAFVDELIGKLQRKYHVAKFMKLVGPAGVTGLNDLLIDHFIRQRLGVSHVKKRTME